MKMPFSFYQDFNGVTKVNKVQANIVKTIFDLYLQGKSLGGIVHYLEDNHILSPNGKIKWTAQSIDNLLSNPKYLKVVSKEKYFNVQHEKDSRSNQTDYNKRKATRYNSQNVLSGLIICGFCGKNYRRITRPNGEIVWRCADKVEYGSKAQCNNLHTVSEEKIINSICSYWHMDEFDETIVADRIEKNCGETK